MPPEAFMYALPWELYAQQGIRRYGAHGTSYRYLVERAATVLSRPASELNLIIAHVGVLRCLAAPSAALACCSQSWARLSILCCYRSWSQHGRHRKRQITGHKHGLDTTGRVLSPCHHPLHGRHLAHTD